MEINKIYIDLDGVLADFDGWKNTIPGLTKQNVWEHAKKVPDFYYQLKPMPEGILLMKYLRSLNIPLAILTALPRRSTMPDAEADKLKWVREHVGDIEFNIGPYAKDKQNFSGHGKILIDDSELNIPQWISRGGTGILYTGFMPCYDAMERIRRT